MRRLFTFLASALFIGSVIADDVQFCIEFKDGTVECYPVDSINKMYLQSSPFNPSGEVDGIDYVDLGLKSGTLWATYDLGASELGELGSIYAWAETEPKLEYSTSTTKYREDNGYVKYLTTDFYNPADNLTRLESVDDAASVNLGPNWRTPTKDEWEELIEGCTWKVKYEPDKTIVRIEGDAPLNYFYALIGTSKKNGKKIYFAKNVSRCYDSFDLLTRYWTSDLNVNDNNNAWQVYIGYGDETEVSKKFSVTNDARYYGCSIRPVTNGK